MPKIKPKCIKCGHTNIEGSRYKNICEKCGTSFNPNSLQLKPVIPVSSQKLSSASEFRRTCLVCGKVWHSLISREKQITTMKKSNILLGCGAALQNVGSCGTTGSGTQAQAMRNLDANRSELNRLHSCPECFSTNYQEEIVDHGNQIKQ